MLKQPLVAAAFVRRPRRRALAVRGTGCLAPSAQAAGGQQSHRFFVCTGQPDGLRLPGDPPIPQSGRAGPSTTRGGSPEAWHGLAGCPEALPAVGLFLALRPSVRGFLRISH